MNKDKNYKRIFFLFLFIIVLVIFLLKDCYIYKNGGNLEISFLDVGEGDAIFIKTPKGKSVLIDGGPSNEVVYKIDEILPFYSRTVDVMVVSHPHADHLTGLIEVLRRYKVKKIFMNNQDFENQENLVFNFEVKNKNMLINNLYEGQELNIEDLALVILWPRNSCDSSDDLNNCSMVFRLSYRDFCAYFTGDINDKIQEEIMQDFNITECVLIKIPHQGAENSISEDFIKIVNPEFGIISVGQDNNYGHPNENILSLLNNNKIKVLRTDVNGDIKVIIDEQGYQIMITNKNDIQ